MGKLLKLGKETMLYGIGSVIPRAINFLLFPLYTRIFNPEAYGIISYLYIFVAFFNVVYSFGMETTFFRYATHKDYSAQSVFNLGQTAVTALGLMLSAIVIFLAKPIASMLDIPHQANYIILLAFIMFIDAIVVLPFAQLRLNHRPLQFALGKMINIIILLSLNVYFFVIIQSPSSQQDYDLVYVFVANLIANACYIIFFIRVFLRWRPLWDQILFTKIVRYASPIVITGLAGLINDLFNRWALIWWLPDNFYPGQSAMHALGVFSAAYKYGVIMSLFIAAFKIAAEPFFFSNASNQTAPSLFARVNHFFVITASFIFIIVVTNIDLLKFLMGKESYYQGLSIVPIVLGSYMWLGIYYNLSVWYKLTDKTRYGMFIMLAGVVVTVTANFILVPIWGYTGSSWASFICYGFMTVTSYILGRRHKPIPYNIIRSGLYVLFALTLCFLPQQIWPYEEGTPWFLRISLPISFLFIVYYVDVKRPRKILEDGKIH